MQIFTSCLVLTLVSANYDVYYKDFFELENKNGIEKFHDYFGASSSEVADENEFEEVSNVTMVYDAYFGTPVTDKRRAYLANVTNSNVLCTVDVRPCRKYEGRRVDGTCSNPHFPSRGARLSPLPRLLPAMFGPGNTLRPANDGSELPSARLLRTTLLGEGYFRDHDFSILATHLFVFSFVDNVDLMYILRYAAVSDCCLADQAPNPAGANCIPLRVPEDDPYLRRAGVRCQNLTRVETYQDYGCLPPSLPAERYSRVTPLLDLSVVYGNTEERSSEVRLHQRGLLAFRMEGDREVPAGNAPVCVGNRLPEETSCYNYGDFIQGNLLPGIFLVAMWFFREHNRLARELAIINPCWGDEKLFQTARQINIAQWQNIFYYELIAELLACTATVGKYMGSRTSVDDEYRSGVLANNGTEADLTQGAYIQSADHFDMVLDPDLVERIHGESHRSSDISTVDIMRGRDAGLPPYNHYRRLCGLEPARRFEDLYDTIDKDKVEQLRRLYDSVEDVELMVAIYVERLLPGTYVGSSLYCIMVRNLLLWRHSDRHFFEHGGATALTLAQLQSVRRTSMARVLCDSGDGVKAVQPRALLTRGPWNHLVPCNKIPGTDLHNWSDRYCKAVHTKK